MLSKKTRSFIAICLENSMTMDYDRIYHQFATVPEIHWVSPNQTHLTLVFLGDRSEDELTSLDPILHHAVKGWCPYVITPSKIDGFPTLYHPRIIWLGIQQGYQKTCMLQSQISTGIDELGLANHDLARSFIPHVTLGRLRSSVKIDPNRVKNIKEMKWRGSQVVHSITLFSSDLTPSGPVYNVLREFDFKNI